MATLTKFFTFVAGTQALASELNGNFEQCRDFINDNVITKDGAKTYTVAPALPATDPSVNTHAVRKSYQDKYPRLTHSASHPLYPPPYLTRGHKIVFGNYTGVTGAGGILTVPFGITFPTALATVQASVISTTVAELADMPIYQYTLSSFGYQCGAGTSGKTVTVCFLAVGW